MRNMRLIAAAGVAALLCSTAAFAASDGKNRKVTVVNNSDQAIQALYAWPKDTNGFHEDMLGSSTIGANSSMTVDFDRGTSDCSFHLLSITHDYGYHETDVDVCTATKWVIENKSNTVQ